MVSRALGQYTLQMSSVFNYLNSGWSFEIDEEDVNKLLESDNIKDASQDTEERTALEDVFR